MHIITVKIIRANTVCIFLFVYFSNFQGRVEFDSAGYRQWEGTYEVAHYRYGMRNDQ